MAIALFGFFSGKVKAVKGAVDFLLENESVKNDFGFSESDLEYKIKNFLDSSALGMVPHKEWDGYAKAHGGYLIVMKSGDLLCYDLHDRDKFQDYLFKNTIFETPSSSRHKFGKLYKKDGRLFFKLNLQIRFLK